MKLPLFICIHIHVSLYLCVLHMHGIYKRNQSFNSKTTPQRRAIERGIKIHNRSTYIIAHKEVIGVGSVAADAEELEEIVKLAVDVAADGDGALDGLHVPLLHEDRASMVAKRLHLRLLEVLALHQMLDLTVQIRSRRHRSSSSAPSDLLWSRSEEGIYGAASGREGRGKRRVRV